MTPEVKRYQNVLHVELMYPQCGPENDRVDTVEVGLCDVRAADSIRITYDYDRDGWSVLQASIFEWEADDTEHDADWQEVAFVPAWGREVIEVPERTGP